MSPQSPANPLSPPKTCSNICYSCLFHFFQQQHWLNTERQKKLFLFECGNEM